MKNITDKDMMNRIIITKIGRPSVWLINAAASIGLDYSGLSHEITNYFQNHVINRHGHGPMPVLESDFANIPAIVEVPDLAVIGAIRGGLYNAYAKRINGETFLYFDEVLDSTHNKALRGSTFYKIAKQLDMGGFEKIITMNGKTDLTKAKKI
jgi:hypothetical protein